MGRSSSPCFLLLIALQGLAVALQQPLPQARAQVLVLVDQAQQRSSIRLGGGVNPLAGSPTQPAAAADCTCLCGRLCRNGLQAWYRAVAAGSFAELLAPEVFEDAV